MHNYTNTKRTRTEPEHAFFQKSAARLFFRGGSVCPTFSNVPVTSFLPKPSITNRQDLTTD